MPVYDADYYHHWTVYELKFPKCAAHDEICIPCDALECRQLIRRLYFDNRGRVCYSAVSDIEVQTDAGYLVGGKFPHYRDQKWTPIGDARTDKLATAIAASFEIKPTDVHRYEEYCSECAA